MRQFTAGPNEQGTRLSRFVLRVAGGLREPALYKAFRNRRIKVNGHRAAADYRLQPGDVIELYLNDSLFLREPATPPRPLPHPAEHYYTAVFDDMHYAILYKPAGVLSHSDDAGNPGLLEAFTASLVESGGFAPAAEHTFAPALCNRLDRGTEGLVIVAKTAPALRAMNAAIKAGSVQKTYLCVCVGTPPQGLQKAWLLRERATHTVQVGLGAPPAGAKAIETGIHLVETRQGLSLCEIQLKTGRTHQIRAHLAFLGAPVLGDAKYGDKALGQKFGWRTQALCAWRLTFPPLPDRGTPLHSLAGKTFTAPSSRLSRWWAGFGAHASHT
ncbi:MAG: RluA family pseudouridine synthase [Oscillospiraceae bacterium]